MSEAPGRKPIGDIRHYSHISLLILVSIIGSGAMLLWLNSVAGAATLERYLPPVVGFGVELFFWGALGAAIASSLYLAADKEQNEVESLKPKPDLSRLRYPTDLDVHLYAHRILTSGCLAVVGALFVYAGLSYFEVSPDFPSSKHRAFYILFAVLIGLYQGNFVTFLNRRFIDMLRRSEARAEAGRNDTAETR